MLFLLKYDIPTLKISSQNEYLRQKHSTQIQGMSLLISMSQAVDCDSQAVAGACKLL